MIYYTCFIYPHYPILFQRILPKSSVSSQQSKTVFLILNAYFFVNLLSEIKCKQLKNINTLYNEILENIKK